MNLQEHHQGNKKSKVDLQCKIDFQCKSIDWFLYDGKHWSLMG